MVSSKARRAVVSEGHPFLILDEMPRRHDCLVLLAKKARQLGRHEIEIGLAHDVRLARPEKTFESRVAHLEGALRILEPHEVRNGAQDQVLLLLAFFQIAGDGFQLVMLPQQGALLEHRQDDDDERADVDDVTDGLGHA